MAQHLIEEPPIIDPDETPANGVSKMVEHVASPSCAPLSRGQLELWVIDQISGQNAANNLIGAWVVRPDLDAQSIRRLLGLLLEKQASFRTTFQVEGGRPAQRVNPLTDPDLNCMDCAAWTRRDYETWLDEQSSVRFDLSRNVLRTYFLTNCSYRDHAPRANVLVFISHHIAADFASVGLTISELNRLGSAEFHTSRSELTYLDYVQREIDFIRGQSGKIHLDYWKAVFEGHTYADQLICDGDGLRGIDSGRRYSRIHIDLPNDVTRQLRAIGRAHSATPYLTFLSAYLVLLHRICGQEDITVGTPISIQPKEFRDVIGFFVNLLPLRVSLEGKDRFVELLGRVKEIVEEAKKHKEMPLGEIVRQMGRTGSPIEDRLFQTTLVWARALKARWQTDSQAHQDQVVLETISSHQKGADRDLTVTFYDDAESLTVVWNFDADLFQPETIHRLMELFLTLLKEIALHPESTIGELALLTDDQRDLVLNRFNSTSRVFPSDRCIHELFEAHAAVDPSAVALVFKDDSLTYGTLNQRSNRLAHYLRRLGIRPDARVAICVDRSFEMIVAVLAVLKAGGAYVPLDPSYPVERLRHMLTDCGPLVVLAKGDVSRSLISGLDSGPLLVDLSQGFDEQPDSDPHPASVGLTPNHLAYVIYTSGSTGKPKGVMVEHRSLCNQFTALESCYELRAGDRVLQFASLAFDMSVEEIFGALCSGAALVLRTDEWLGGPESFWALCASHRVTVANLPSLYWQQVTLGAEGNIPPCLRQIMIGGDAVRPEALKGWFKREGHRPSLFNAYGPTEATVNATIHETVPARSSLNSIGRPVANTRVYILDAYAQPVPVGVRGELYIGGIGVARGYLNRPELTMERFLHNPLTSETGARMYRTGDFARWSADGSIEFLGRNDFQVKIRGFRIEAGEVEAILMKFPAVREAIVVAREDAPGHKRLVAYYTTEADALIDAVELRSHLAAHLPDYMVPAAYVQLDSLPLTLNGKVDRRALPAPGADAYSTGRFEPPLGEVEAKLAQIWMEVLGLDRVGRYDNFFALGGHSLLAVRVVTRLRQKLGINAAMRDVFAHPLLIDLANAFKHAAHAELPRIVPAERHERLPLSFAQQRLWFLAQMEQVSLAYHISGGLRLTGTLDHAALRSTLNRIMARHEALRTTFSFAGEKPVQRVAPAGERTFVLLEHDLREHCDVQNEFGRLSVLEAGKRFDLERGPLIRGRLIRLADDEHALLITMHHIVSDGWSMGVLVNELSALYSAFLLGMDDPLPEPEIQYVDYAVWKRQWIEGEILQQQAAYWKQTLDGAPALLEVPGDHPRPAEQDYSGAFTELVFDEHLTAALNELSRRHDTTLFMTLLVAWAALLAKLSGQQDVVIGTPAANRGRAEIENLIGFFVNTLAIRLDLSGRLTVSELLRQTKEQTLAAQQHQDIPFEQIVELSNTVRSVARSPLFQVMFVWQNAAKGSLELPDLEAQPLSPPSCCMAKFDLTLCLQEEDGGIAGGIEYSTSLFEPSTIDRYLGYLRTLLHAMVADPTQTIDHLPLLTAAERDRLLSTWNDTAIRFPNNQCIHQIFEEQALVTPTSIAVLFEDQSLTYAELNCRANQLAHYLRRLGVRPDDRVAICVERGFEMIVAMLAVLKAGAAYVPLDPDYPVERLRFMIEDSTPVAVLTQSHLDIVSGATYGTLPILDLSSASPRWQSLPETNPSPDDVGLGPHHLAYMIYTSGSTGQPKGVMVEHRNVGRLFAATDSWFHFKANDVWTLFHSYAFDFSVWEIWGALLHGGRLVVVPKNTARSPEEFYRLVCREKVTVLNQTPSAFRRFITAQAATAEEHYLRYVIFGGEALEVAILRPWYERNKEDQPQLINMYGITETTVHVTYRALLKADTGRRGASPIGGPIPDVQVYILNACREPVPVGVIGELYVGGAGVARGYLNRPELTADRFLHDPFSSDPGTRMYRTGDLGRWLADGNIEFLGRNDSQVKIRGFRIELAEIEARLLEHAAVREAVVVAYEDTSVGQRLIAYYVTEVDASVGVEQLRSHLAASLPEYMVPAAYVRMEALPLTPNGKLDRVTLPTPEIDAYSTHRYEPPCGETETKLAGIWAEVLRLNQVGRHDNFFTLGGHSLIAVTLIERMRRDGFTVDVRTLFATPTLADLAAAVGQDTDSIKVPPNLIPSDCAFITPEMLPLVNLSQAEIEQIVSTVPGGAPNVQDIYPLGPLQEGIFFHHLMGGEGDPYLLSDLSTADTRDRLRAFLVALQAVIDRHDIMRTAMVWEGLAQPVQVVRRKAVLHVEEVELDPAAGDAAEQLYARFDPRRFRIDLHRAPMMQVCVCFDVPQQRWLMLTLWHHLIGDHTTLEVIQQEMQAHLLGEPGTLPTPTPYRDVVAQAQLGVSPQEHEAFFCQMLMDVDEPTAPFGLLQVLSDAREIEEAHASLDNELARRVRASARCLGVSAASLCHLAWAQVLAKVSGRVDVVFGTVVFGRMQGSQGTDRGIGPFINTLPVRIRLGEQGVEAAVRRTHTLLADLMRHEHASLALAQRCSAVPAPVPLFSALLNYRHDQALSTAPGETWEGIRRLRGEERTNYPLTLSVNDLGEGFSLDAQAPASIDPSRICGFMIAALDSLVEALETAALRPVHAVDILPTGERHRVVYEWNDTATEFPNDKRLHELFEQQTLRTPEAIALVFEDQSLTYDELNRRANQLAHYLRAFGVRPDTRVALCLDRSFEMVIALLAVLKAGGAYVPLDPGLPIERLRFMIEDSAPLALLTETRLEGLISTLGYSLPVFALDAVAPPWTDQPETNPSPDDTGISPDHLAYVIYTSGSTGQPKGVMVPHRGVVNRLTWMQRTYELSPDEAVLQKTPFGFDVSVWEFFWTLSAGARLVMARPEGHKDPAYLIETIRRNEVTTIHFVPSMLHIFLEHPDVATLGSLVHVVCSGEALSAALVQRFRQLLPHAGLHNLYGPTEAAVDVTFWNCPADFSQSVVPIGKPIANTQMYILDAHRQPVPVGVTGELYIGGVQVARGYLNQPKLTEEKFIPDSFGSVPYGRMYRTGDLGRWLPDGNIEFLGRNDFQVKIRGFRIELGEIETRLMDHPSVREATVLAREDTPGDKRLVAYYTTSFVGDREQDILGAEELRSHLSAALPEYMVPAAYVHLEALPLTPNGKLDRKALPAPGSDAYSALAYEPPKGDVETRMAQIWAEVLRLDQVGRHDNFFALGGHSLLAVTLIERMRREGFTADVRTLFATPTLADLAVTVGNSTNVVEVPPNLIPSSCERITPEMLPLVKLSQDEIDRIVSAVPGGTANIQDIYPLAPLQEGILFHHIMGGEADPYVITSLTAVDTRDRLNAFLAAMQAVIDRHDILRTALAWEDLSQPVQVVLRKAALDVEHVELDPASGDPGEQLYARFEQHQIRIDLRRAPMLRVCVAFDSAARRWLLLTLWHHVIGDHTTLDVVREEIQHHLLGRAELLARPTPFRNAVAQARLGVSQGEHEAFFRQMLGDVDEPTAPFGLLDVRGDGSGIEDAHVALNDDLARRIYASARRLRVSAASLCHLAWAQVLARVSGREDVVFGTVLFGRMQGGKGTDRGIGLFINTLPLRISIRDEGVEDSVRRTHILLADLMRHEHTSLALAQRCSRVSAPTPLFSALLNYRHDGPDPTSSSELIEAWHGIEELRGGERTNYPLTLSVNDLGEGFSLDAQSPRSVGPMRICEFMQSALESLVDALENAPATAVRRLNVLPPAELRQILYEWNATEAAYPKDACVHDLFEAQAATTPDAVAVVSEQRQLTYTELNARANRMAHYLRFLGVVPDARVAICVERGFEMIVGVLAVLKAGGAYVPLDPAYPQARLRHMLEDCAPTVVLTQGHLRDLFSGCGNGLHFLDLNETNPPWNDHSDANPDRTCIGLTSQHLAYVIYTSGSTGQPKGVMGVHTATVNRFEWMYAKYPFEVDEVCCARASLSFVDSIWELLGPLCRGTPVVLFPSALNYDLPNLIVALANYHITRLVIVPSMMRALVELFLSSELSFPQLKYWSISGETLFSQLANDFLKLAKGKLLNLYGSSEDSADATCYEIGTSSGAASVPIGKPIANTRVYILDTNGEPVPKGVAGELYIGGAGVARGYLNRPDWTAERFLKDPFGVDPDAQIYRTGDRGRWLEDGNIEFLGRTDFQVKIRGVRIELGEIEARLTEHPGVCQAIVVTREDSPGDTRLVTYYRPAETSAAAFGAEQLRVHLSTLLPEHMVPSAYVRMESLPLTPNGKLDRRALPVPDTDAYSTSGYEPPQGELETKLAQIWAEVLGLEQIGRNDNFFSLGGHSLMAMKMITRLRQELGMDIAIRDLFAHPVLADLPHALQDSAPDMKSPIRRVKRGMPLAPISVRVATATGSAGQRIASRDNGESWYDMQTGKVME